MRRTSYDRDGAMKYFCRQMAAAFGLLKHSLDIRSTFVDGGGKLRVAHVARDTRLGGGLKQIA